IVKDVAVQDISVAAVLYFVPKPGNEQQLEANAATSESSKPIEEDFDAAIPEENQLLNFEEQDKKENPKAVADAKPAINPEPASPEKIAGSQSNETIPPLVPVTSPADEANVASK